MIHGWILEADRHEGILGAPEFSSRPALVGSRSDSTPARIRIGIALGGGFARGIAHAGVLKVLQQFSLPIHCITGVSARAIVAAAYASGASPDEIARLGYSMRLSDLARWSPRLLGLVGSDRMNCLPEKDPENSSVRGDDYPARRRGHGSGHRPTRALFRNRARCSKLSARAALIQDYFVPCGAEESS